MRTAGSFTRFARAGALLAAAGCAFGYATVLPLGRGAPPRPHDCPVRYTDLLQHEAQRLYEQVGIICYTYPGAPANVPSQDVIMKETRAEACRLGGEVVVRHGYCPGYNRRAGLEFGVYVTRPRDAAPVARDDRSAAAADAGRPD
jgi:hypothetical protein